MIVARAAPHSAQSGDWRARVLTVALRALRSVGGGALGALGEGEPAEVATIVTAGDDEQLGRAAERLERELTVALPGFAVIVAQSRCVSDPVDLYRAGKEAVLAANVGEAEGRSLLAFEDTGAYRLLLPAMSEDPGELERFYEETLAPLVGVRRPVRDRPGGHGRGVPGERRERRADRRRACSRTGTRSATGSSGCASSVGTTSRRARGARSSAWG